MGKDKLRKVAVSGHQIYWEGYFHAWCGLSEYASAIVEDKWGRISIVSATQIEFLDRKKK